MGTDNESAPITSGTGSTRRGLIGGVVLGSAALGAGAAGGLVTRAASSTSFKRKRLTIEVACLGELWREATKSNPANDGDFRTSFGVEGWIYPQGTILGDGFIPTEQGSIGRWFCRGFIIIDSVRSEPHATSHQDLYFGSIRPDRLFPASMLSTSGLEGTTDRTQTSVRAVIGGTGEFLGATGQVGQTVIATNTSLFADGTDDPAPCFRLDIDVRVLE